MLISNTTKCYRPTKGMGYGESHDVVFLTKIKFNDC